MLAHFQVDQLGRREYDVMEQVKFLRTSRAVDSLKHHNSANMYIFSKNGHGRTGIVGASLLGRLYGLSVPDVMEMNQRLHDVRATMQVNVCSVPRDLR